MTVYGPKSSPFWFIPTTGLLFSIDIPTKEQITDRDPALKGSYHQKGPRSESTKEKLKFMDRDPVFWGSYHQNGKKEGKNTLYGQRSGPLGVNTTIRNPMGN